MVRKQGLDEKMRLKIEPGTCLAFLCISTREWRMVVGMAGISVSVFSAEWGLMGGALSESERGRVVPTIDLWNSTLFRNFEVADRELSCEFQDSSSWRLVYQA